MKTGYLYLVKIGLTPEEMNMLLFLTGVGIGVHFEMIRNHADNAVAKTKLFLLSDKLLAGVNDARKEANETEKADS